MNKTLKQENQSISAHEREGANDRAADKSLSEASDNSSSSGCYVYPEISVERSDDSQCLSSLTSNPDDFMETSDYSDELSSLDDESKTEGEFTRNEIVYNNAAMMSRKKKRKNAPCPSPPHVHKRLHLTFDVNRGENFGYEDDELSSMSSDSVHLPKKEPNSSASCCFSSDLDLRDRITTAAGQMEAHPRYTKDEAVTAAKREYNRRNAARSRMRSKHVLKELEAKCTRLTWRIEKLDRVNGTLKARFESLSREIEEPKRAVPQHHQSVNSRQTQNSPLIQAPTVATVNTTTYTFNTSNSSNHGDPNLNPLFWAVLTELLRQIQKQQQQQQKQHEAQQQEAARTLLFHLLSNHAR